MFTCQKKEERGKTSCGNDGNMFHPFLSSAGNVNHIVTFCFQKISVLAPLVYRKIPVYRNLTQVLIPGFLKIKYLYFCIAHKDNDFKDVYWFLATLETFGDCQNL